MTSKKKLDRIEKDILITLEENGRMKIEDIFKETKRSRPAIKSKIETLTSEKIVNITCGINAAKFPNIMVAFVNIKLREISEEDNLKENFLRRKMTEISKIDQVQWVCVVSGEHDMMAKVISFEGAAGLYKFTSEKLKKVGGILTSQSVIVMQSKNLNIRLPKDMKKEINKKTIYVKNEWEI